VLAAKRAKRNRSSCAEAGRAAGFFSKHCITSSRSSREIGSPASVVLGSGLGGSWSTWLTKSLKVGPPKGRHPASIR
jgi:hypothetical protein